MSDELQVLDLETFRWHPVLLKTQTQAQSAPAQSTPAQSAPAQDTHGSDDTKESVTGTYIS